MYQVRKDRELLFVSTVTYSIIKWDSLMGGEVYPTKK